VTAPDRPGVVLVGFDGAPASRELLRTAAEIAQARSASLVVAHIVHLPALPSIDSCPLEYGLDMNDIGPRVFPDIVEALWDLDVAVGLLVRVGDVATEIARIARRQRVELVIVGAGRPVGVVGRLRRIAFGSVAEQLVRMLPHGLIAVPEVSPFSTGAALTSFGTEGGHR
jgi:nucleotide-binding universal stress UspA family protein